MAPVKTRPKRNKPSLGGVPDLPNPKSCCHGEPAQQLDTGQGAVDVPAGLVGFACIASVMLDAGFPRDLDVLATGVSIIQCENSQKVKGCNSLPACGAWQINLRAHPSMTRAKAENFCTATRFAHSLWLGAGRKWTDWEASRSCWEGNIETNKKALEGQLGQVSEGGLSLPDPLEGLKLIGELLATLFEPTFWLRVGKGLLGALMLAMGIIALMRALLGIDLPGYAERTVSRAGVARGRRAARRAGGRAPTASERRSGRRALEGDRIPGRSRAGRERRSGREVREANEDVPF